MTVSRCLCGSLALLSAAALADATDAAWARAKWIGEDLPPGIKAVSEKNCPVFRTTLDLPDAPAKAEVTATGLGFFEVYVNGRKAGDEVLTPSACDWTHRCYYYVWDVAALLKKGANEIRIWTAPGYSDDFFEFGWRRVAEFPKRARLALAGVCADGTPFDVTTDGSWQVSSKSPISFASIYRGERYDAGFDGWDWQPAKVLDDFDRQEVVNRVPELWRPRVGPPELRRFDGAPVRLYGARPPKAILRPNRAAHAFVVDAGVNRAGVVEIRAKGPRGTVVTLSYAEELDPVTNDLDMRTNRTRETIRDTFALAGTGDWETYRPRFTYHGFRYVRVDGYPGELTADDVTCYAVGADVATTGGFECSDPFLNRFHAAAVNSMRSNFMSYPTDCPMRDERTPCQLDSQVYEETAMLNFDMRSFYAKWLDDIDLGGIGGRFSPDWMGDGIVLPWRHYVAYADRDVLARNDPIARGKFEKMLAAYPGLVVDWGFGDWCVPNDGARGYLSAFGYVKEVNTALFAYAADCLAKSAAALGRPSEADRYAGIFERIRRAYNAAFFRDGAYEGGAQTPTALAFAFGLVDPSARAGAYRALVRHIRERDGGKFTTGIWGTSLLGEVLADGGDADLMLAMMKGPGYPSFGYMFEKFDATSLWEQWHPYGEMNTHNHAMMAGAEKWLFTRILGIRPSGPGTVAVVEPVAPSSLQWARGHVTTPNGRVEVAWHRDAEGKIVRDQPREFAQTSLQTRRKETKSE